MLGKLFFCPVQAVRREKKPRLTNRTVIRIIPKSDDDRKSSRQVWSEERFRSGARNRPLQVKYIREFRTERFMSVGFGRYAGYSMGIGSNPAEDVCEDIEWKWYRVQSPSRETGKVFV